MTKAKSIKPKKRKLRTAKIRPSSTLVTKDHKGEKQDGHVERLSKYTKRALELSRLGHIYVDIAEMIAAEFELERTPAISTISAWLHNGVDAYEKDITDLRWQMRFIEVNRIDKLLEKWTTIVLKDEIEIRRWRLVEGSDMPFFDEDVMAEQLHATSEIVKLIARKAKLLGLDLQEAIGGDKKDGPKSLQDLQLWIINQVNFGPGATAPPGGQILELEPGIPEIEDDIKEEE